MALNKYRLTYAGLVIGDVQYKEFAGLSTYTKPEDRTIMTGSMLHEVDTKSVYSYNEDGEAGEKWVFQMKFSEDE